MTIEIEGKTYFPAAEVARAVGVSRQTLWRWRQMHKVPPGRRFRDRQIVFTPDELNEIQEFAARLEPARVP
jgi:transposase-like protein